MDILIEVATATTNTVDTLTEVATATTNTVVASKGESSKKVSDNINNASL